MADAEEDSQAKAENDAEVDHQASGERHAGDEADDTFNNLPDLVDSDDDPPRYEYLRPMLPCNMLCSDIFCLFPT